MANPRYLSRICWNTRGWIQPSGDAPGLEQKGTYISDHGFGHEEWLFNLQWELDGWKYSFLQPINSSWKSVKGQTLDVRLYAIAGPGSWYYAGEIPDCEVLSAAQASSVYAHFEKNGWLDEMREHVKAVGGDVGGLEPPHTVFNIRFRPGDATLYDPSVAFDDDDAVHKFPRYKLINLNDQREHIEKEWQKRVASTKNRPTGKGERKATDPTVIDLAHNSLQNEMAALFRKKYGHSAVTVEADFVDIRVKADGKDFFIEVKSDSRPRYAVRQALGQLLEYAFAAKAGGAGVPELIVAAPGELNSRDAKYLEHLRNHWKLPIKYVCFRRGMASIQL